MILDKRILRWDVVVSLNSNDIKTGLNPKCYKQEKQCYGSREDVNDGRLLSLLTFPNIQIIILNIFLK